jgi:UDP-glucose 4-epimerase
MAGAPRVLVTGSSGGVGRVAQSVLAGAAWDVQPFDLAQRKDLRDPQSVLDAMRGCIAAVHAGALADDSAGSSVDIVTTNVLGTWHVLAPAEQCGLSRMVYFSSAQVFGFAEGEGSPAYLPVDDDHPVRASRPYGMSKRLAEEICRAWTTRTGIPTIVLRRVRRRVWRQDHPLSCLLVVCSDAAVRPVSARHYAAGNRDEVRTDRHRPKARALI